MEANIVENWLRSLNVVQYTEAFLDNGYDDLEVCKQIGTDDLDAIGVKHDQHRADILAAAQQLLEHGGTAVYFTLDPEYQRQGAGEPLRAGAGLGPGVVSGTSGQHCQYVVGVGPSCVADKENYGYQQGYRHHLEAGTQCHSPTSSSCPQHTGDQYEAHRWAGLRAKPTDQPGCGSAKAVVSINGPCAGGSVVHGHSLPPDYMHYGSTQDQASSQDCTTHRALPTPTTLPLPPPPAPPSGYCLAGLQGRIGVLQSRIGVPLPLPPCQQCQGVTASSPHCQCRHDEYSDVMAAMTSCMNTLVTYPKVQLSNMVRDKLHVDDIALADSSTANQSDKHHFLERLAQQYAEDLNTHTQDVFLCLIELDGSPLDSNGHDSSPGGDSDLGDPEPCSMFSVYGQASRSVPPPLPPCQPPCTLYEDPDTLSILKRESPSHSSRSPLLPPARQSSEEGAIDYPLGALDLHKKGVTLGWLFRKKAAKKYIYKQYEGDLNASQITMPEDDRINLMLLVKEGKLSMHEAVERVKHYEHQKRDEQDSQLKEDREERTS